MSTQLRLLANGAADGTADGVAKGDAREPGTATAGSAKQTAHKARATARRAGARARRPIHWQEQWRLDERTRRVGQAGVASARAALARAAPTSTLPRAS